MKAERVCRLLARPAIMRDMFLSRLPRLLIARITLVALLFCYGLAMAHTNAVGVGTPANVADCHSATGGSETPGRAPASACDAAQAASDAFKLPPVTWPAVSAAWAPPVDIAGPRPGLPAWRVTRAGAPPPLRLLHCRFLN
jgi:hypothetical protein